MFPDNIKYENSLEFRFTHNKELNLYIISTIKDAEIVFQTSSTDFNECMNKFEEWIDSVSD